MSADAAIYVTEDLNRHRLGGMFEARPQFKGGGYLIRSG